jgi:hypothetical protein
VSSDRYQCHSNWCDGVTKKKFTNITGEEANNLSCNKEKVKEVNTVMNDNAVD